MSDAPIKVYFDGACPLCRAEIGHYQKQEGAEGIDFVDLSILAQDPAADLSRQAALARFHVRRPDGRLVSGAAAFATLWSSLPHWRWAGRIAGWKPILWLLELAYRGFLPLRPFLARLARRHFGPK